MRVLHESPDLLIVAEPAVGLRVTGGVLVAIGMIFLLAGARIGNLTSALAGAGTLLVGALFVVLPATTAFHFDRSGKRFVVARRRTWDLQRGATVHEYPLRDVAGARVDESRSDDGSTWRLIVQLSDGRTIPLTSYYSSNYESKVQMANRISAFLGVRASAVVLPPPSPYAIKHFGRRAAIGLALLFVAAGALFASIGGVMLAREYHRLSSWLPVQATVLGTRVDVRSDSDGDTYRPVVEYRYQVDDRPYTSTRTLPIAESRSGKWAHRVIDRFTVGNTYTAWYDPEAPSQAFIVRSRSIIAPVFALIGALVTLGGCLGVVSAVRTKVA